MNQNDSANPDDSRSAEKVKTSQLACETKATVTRLVRCPSCGKSTEFSPRNPARPFCTVRCRDLDLGNWATERYNLSTPLHEAVEDALQSMEVSGSPDEAEELRNLIDSLATKDSSQES